MTAGVLLLYGMKLRMFLLGPLRRQPATVAVLALVAALTLPGAYAFGYFLGETPFAAPSLVDLAALVVSLFAALAFLLAPGGGFLLQPAEVDFVATGPVSVRRFALADVLFQCTFYGASLLFVALAALGYGIRTGAPPWAFLVPVAALGLLLFSVLLLVQSLGIARLSGKRWASPAAALGAVLLLLPGLAEAVSRVPGAYARLPYPTTAAVHVALLPFGLGDPAGIPLLAGYAILALGVHALATDRATIPNLKGTFAFTPEAKRAQQEALLRAFGRVRRTRGARLHRPTLVGTMTALHVVRSTRDGTLFLALAMAAVLGLPSFLAGDFRFGGLYVTLFLPIAATAQWMVSDRPNLWILSVSRAPPETFFLGWWSALAGITAVAGGAIPALAGIVAGGVDLVAVVATVASALAGTAGAVVSAAKLPYAPNEFSAVPLLHMLIAGGMTAAGFLPPFAVGSVLAADPAVALAATSGVALAVAWAARSLVIVGARRPAIGP